MPPFVDLLSAARKRLQFCPCISAIVYAKKRGIGKKLILTIRVVMLGEHVDLVAGDFNGATALCQRRLVPHPCGDQVRFQAAGLMCGGFSSRPNPIGIGKFDFTVPFPFIPHEAPGLRPTDQSCHHETWLHLDFVEWQDVQSQREKYNRKILSKERPAPYHYCNQKKAHQ